MATLKDIIKKLEYSLEPPTGTPTKVEIPINRVLADNATPFAEEAQLADLINGAKIGAATDGNAKYPVIVNTGDTFMAALEAAMSDGQPVWFYETLIGGAVVTIGGDTGCTGSVNLGRGGRGGFVMKMIDAYAPGADTGDSYTITPGA